MQERRHKGRAAILPAALLLLLVPVCCRAAHKTEVLIYYANENSPNEAERRNYKTIIGWLRSGDTEKLQQMADSLERDTVQFPETVDAEIEVLRHRLRRVTNGVGAVVFTNRSVRSGKYLVFHDGQSAFIEGAIETPQHENLIEASNPLCTPEVFERCLREVARQFDPADHEFILWTKSHGNLEMAMTPRIAVRAEDTNRENLLAVAADNVDDGARPEWVKRLGVTKQQYFSTLEALGKSHGMRFSLVYVESCEGVLGQDLKVKLPRTVDRMYTTGNEQANYVNLDLDAVFDRCTTDTPLGGAMEAALAAKFPGITRRRDGSMFIRRRYLLYWLPLLVWVVWFVRRRIRKRA